jgi:hypothetical protein
MKFASQIKLWWKLVPQFEKWFQRPDKKNSFKAALSTCPVDMSNFNPFQLVRIPVHLVDVKLGDPAQFIKLVDVFNARGASLNDFYTLRLQILLSFPL